MGSSAGRTVRTCPHCGERYGYVNFMRRYVLPDGSVWQRRGRPSVPPGTRFTDSHRLACGQRHGLDPYGAAGAR